MLKIQNTAKVHESEALKQREKEDEHNEFYEDLPGYDVVNPALALSFSVIPFSKKFMFHFDRTACCNSNYRLAYGNVITDTLCGQKQFKLYYMHQQFKTDKLGIYKLLRGQ